MNNKAKSENSNTDGNDGQNLLNGTISFNNTIVLLSRKRDGIKNAAHNLGIILFTRNILGKTA